MTGDALLPHPAGRYRPWPAGRRCRGVALDLGSARTRAWIAGRGVVVDVPTVTFAEDGALYPVRRGAIVDVAGCARMLGRVLGLVGLYLDPPERALVFCVDEKTQIQALDRSQPVLPMMPGVPQRVTHDYVRAGTTTLFAALEVATGKVIGSLHRRHRAEEFKKFLLKLDQEIPADLQVHLILDNYATHKTPAVKSWLVAHPRFQLHFTPTGSSWLNLVERWFAELTNKQIRRGVHKSVHALEKDIRTWIAAWNTDPKPYVWTRTADEILERLASYLRRIPDSEH
ncbi:IS630 family transposase [Streptomyces longwoodensis]|uniref:IS630 family transposase n=1 Tax=Streptomyces longwoodensis TaxID=68231 RepID=UPI0033ED8A4D